MSESGSRSYLVMPAQRDCYGIACWKIRELGLPSSAIDRLGHGIPYITESVADSIVGGCSHTKGEVNNFLLAIGCSANYDFESIEFFRPPPESSAYHPYMLKVRRSVRLRGFLDFR